MKTKTLRIIIPLLVMVVIAAGYATSAGIGTLAAFGWQDISLLCPLGALSTMLASKLVVPRAVVSIVVAVALILVVGRAFCAWICPVPVVSKLRDAFSRKDAHSEKASKRNAHDGNNNLHAETTVTKTAAKQEEGESSSSSKTTAAALSQQELASLKGCGADAANCKGHAHDGKAAKHSCSSCASKRAALDSRHFVLGGALASAAIFGFPVFCLICPIGLTFATILLVMRMFAGGDMTWAIVVVPALLLVEVVFFRKWCANFCPLSALMSLIAKANRTFQPRVNESVCLETSKGATCGKCEQACPEGINVRHPELGASWSECTRCRACVDACPTHAISIPLLAKGQAGNSNGSGSKSAALSEGGENAENMTSARDGNSNGSGDETRTAMPRMTTTEQTLDESASKLKDR